MNSRTSGRRLSVGQSAALAILVARISSVSAGAVQLPVMAHLVDATTFSALSTIIAVSVFITLIGFEGTIMAFQRFPYSRDDVGSYSFSHRRLVLSTLAISSVTAISAPFSRYADYAFALIGWGFGLAWMRFVSAAWLMWQRPWHYAGTLIASTLARTTLFLWLLAIGFHAPIAFGVAGLSSAAIALIFGPRPHYGASSAHVRPWPKGFATSLALSSVGVTLITGVDRMLAFAILGPRDAAPYLAMAGLAALSLGSALSLINTAIYPQLINNWQNNQQTEVSRCINRALLWTIFVTAGSLPIAVLAASAILPLLFPRSYVQPHLLLGVLVATGLIAVGLVYSWKFQLATSGRSLRNRTAFAAVCTLVLVVTAGSAMGADGVCLGLMLGAATYCLVMEAFPRMNKRRAAAPLMLLCAGLAAVFSAPLATVITGSAGAVLASALAAQLDSDVRVLRSIAKGTTSSADTTSKT